MYLTYEEYKGYGGGLAEGDFTQAELRAAGRLDWLTGGRLRAMADRAEASGGSLALPEAVKLAMMSAIRADGAVGADAQAESPMVASFSTDGYSETYGGAAERTGAVEKQLNAGLRRLLFGVRDDEGVPLLYRGL